MTALVYSLFYGGTITRVRMRNGGNHFYNSPGNSSLCFDLTHDSFGSMRESKLGPIASERKVDPEEMLQDENVRRRFNLMLQSVLQKLQPQRQR